MLYLAWMDELFCSAIMAAMQLGKISSDELKLLLDFYPQLAGVELAEARRLMLENQDIIFAEDVTKAVWCHLYELPAKEHFVRAMVGLGGEGVLREIAQCPNQIHALPGATAKALAEIEAWEPTKEEADAVRKYLPTIFGLAMSLTNSVRSLMVFGCYLNDLIAQVRAGGESGNKALLSAVKIDPTVLGCPSVITRMSRSVMLDDQKFLAQVRKAMTSKFTKREQKNYQCMRIVLQVLYETGAPKLNEADLYALFVEELKLVSGERVTDEGNVANALRQFVYQFMKDKPVSQSP